MKKTNFIVQLPIAMQQSIRKELVSLGLNQKDIEAAMNSRLCDLEDTIDIKKYL